MLSKNLTHFVTLLLVTLSLGEINTSPVPESFDQNHNESLGAEHGAPAHVLVKYVGITALEWLGMFNGKQYFLDRTPASQYVARENCRAASMELLPVLGQQESEYIRTRLLDNNIDSVWTDAYNYQHNNGFVSNGAFIPASYTIMGLPYGQIGLVLYSWPPLSLSPFSKNSLHHYICVN